MQFAESSDEENKRLKKEKRSLIKVLSINTNNQKFSSVLKYSPHSKLEIRTLNIDS